MAVDGKTYPKTCLRIQPSIGTTNNGVRQVVCIEKLMALLHEATREQVKKKENGLP